MGQSPYSATKIAADQLALSYYKSFNIPIKVVRPFNTYGPRQSARAIIPTVITQILSGETEISLGNTTPTRDFTYVLDTCLGFLEIFRSKELFIFLPFSDTVCLINPMLLRPPFIVVTSVILHLDSVVCTNSNYIPSFP